MLPDLIGLIPRWVAEARCAEPGLDPEMFFPHTGESSLEATESVRRFCRGCTVVNQCAEYAIANEIDDGIWGGLTPHTRRRLVGRRMRNPQPPARSGVCRRCGAPVTGGTTSEFCGDACRRDDKHAYMRDYKNGIRRRAS